MKSKCGKLKTKGWKAEQKIDEMLEIKTIFPVSIEYEKDCRKVFKQAKTCIQSLNSMVKSLNEKIDDMWDTIEDCEGEISQLRKEKEKLKRLLIECKYELRGCYTDIGWEDQSLINKIDNVLGD